MWLQISKMHSYVARKGPKHLKCHFLTLNHFCPPNRKDCWEHPCDSRTMVFLFLRAESIARSFVWKAEETWFNCSQPFNILPFQRQASQERSLHSPSDGTIWTQPQSGFVESARSVPELRRGLGTQVCRTADGLEPNSPLHPLPEQGPKMHIRITCYA